MDRSVENFEGTACHERPVPVPVRATPPTSVCLSVPGSVGASGSAFARATITWGDRATGALGTMSEKDHAVLTVARSGGSFRGDCFGLGPVPVQLSKKV